MAAVRGFALLTVERRRQIASMGGKASKRGPNKKVEGNNNG